MGEKDRPDSDPLKWQVWRIHLKNDVSPPKTRTDLLRFCHDYQVIGVGWDTVKTHGGPDEIRREALEHYGEKEYLPAYKAINAMRKMQTGDLIWTYVKENSGYYLCRVKGTWADRVEYPEQAGLDIENHLQVDWLKIGREEAIPGIVRRAFGYSSSVQRIYGAEQISALYWNHYASCVERLRNIRYDVPAGNHDIWAVMPPECVEENVLLYLQVVKGYAILTNTLKHDTPVYECTMVNARGKRRYPQVKSGKEKLDADRYMDAIHADSEAHVYLFSAAQNYKKNACDRIHYLTLAEMEDFLHSHRALLSEKSRIWLDSCGFQ